MRRAGPRQPGARHSWCAGRQGRGDIARRYHIATCSGFLLLSNTERRQPRGIDVSTESSDARLFKVYSIRTCS